MCGVIADRAERVIAVLEGWKLRVPGLGRLRQQRALLRGVASAGCFPRSQTELVRIGHSIRDVSEFWQIVKWIGEERSEHIATDLDRALRGTVDQVEPTRKPYQFQSQLWIGAVLEYGGLEPTVPPPTGRRSPDFMVRVGSALYPIEVKRPEQEATIQDALASAVGQIVATGRPGVVAIDLSDCLDRDATVLVVESSRDAPHAAANEQYLRMRDNIGDTVFDHERRQLRPGFGSIMGLMLFARGFRWRLDDLSYPDPFTMSQIGVFTNARGNLRYHHARTILESMHEGLKKGGLFISQVSTLSL
jgi:hypothetical protein